MQGLRCRLSARDEDGKVPQRLRASGDLEGAQRISPFSECIALRACVVCACALLHTVQPCTIFWMVFLVDEVEEVMFVKEDG